MRKALAITTATFFGTGYFPKASGTIGSLVAMPFALAIAWFGGFWALLTWATALYAVGVIAVKEVLKHSDNKDPSFVVIDEACGQSIALLPLAPVINEGVIQWPFVITAFVLFRIFDIVKPWPASYFDKKMRSAHGVMLDDVAAGIYAIAGLCVVAGIQAVIKALLFLR